jgi:hypothetical protein
MAGHRVPVQPRIVRQAHRIGDSERNAEDRGVGPADSDAQPRRRQAELSRAGPSDLRLGEDAIRPRIAQQLERAIEARLSRSCDR